MSFSNIIPEAKSCVYSLIRVIYRHFNYKKQRKELELSKIIFIDSTIKVHLKIWLIFVLRFRYCSISRLLYVPSNQIVISSDASKLGYGFFCLELGFFASVRFEGLHRYLHINFKELYGGLISIFSMLPYVQGKTVKLLIDNTSVVASIAHRWSKSSIMMVLIFELCALATYFRFRFFVDWISSEANDYADALTRFQWDRFDSLCDLYDVDRKNLKNIKIFEPKQFLFHRKI